MPNAGGLRDRCEFQSESIAADGRGGGVSSWATQLTVWGRLVMNAGTERFDAGRNEDSATGVLHVRSSAESKTILPNWRVVIDGVNYAIVSPVQDRQRTNQWLQMSVRRGEAI